MEVSLSILIGAGLTFLFLVYKIIDLRGKVGKPDIRWIDTSGISSIKNRNYIDIEYGRTLNIPIGGQNIIIAHLPWKVALNHVEAIAHLWAACKQLIEYQPENDLEIKIREMNFARIYFQISKHIIAIASPFIKKKRKVRNEIARMAKEDITGIMDITEKILDFWMPIKKKLQFLAEGQTLKSMVGERYSWNSTRWDDQGMILIEQRFMNSLN